MRSSELHLPMSSHVSIVSSSSYESEVIACRLGSTCSNATTTSSRIDATTITRRSTFTTTSSSSAAIATTSSNNNSSSSRTSSNNSGSADHSGCFYLYNNKISFNMKYLLLNMESSIECVIVLTEIIVNYKSL